MGKRKFRLKQRVFVNAHAIGNSWFVGHYGRVADYDRDKKMYGIVFKLPGNGHEEYRKFSAYKLSLLGF